MLDKVIFAPDAPGGLWITLREQPKNTWFYCSTFAGFEVNGRGESYDTIRSWLAHAERVGQRIRVELEEQPDTEVTDATTGFTWVYVWTMKFFTN
jgi:hypothetical protein